MLWSLLFTMIHTAAPQAVHFSERDPFDDQFFHYYSFTVLTAVRFRNITPENRMAMNLTTLEAITGQMFIAIFIARLISLYVVQGRNN